MAVIEEVKPSDKPADDPRYLSAKRKSDELIGTASRRARSWKIAFMTVCIVLVCQTLILVNHMENSRMNVLFVRYDDNLATSTIDLKGSNKFTPRDAELQKFLRDFIINFRSRSTDPFVTKQRQASAIKFVSGGARKYFDKTIEEENRLMKINKMQDFIRNVYVPNVVRGSDASFIADWKETSYDTTGNVVANKNYKGVFTYAILPVTDKSQAEDNPLGLYITVIDISEQKAAY